VQLAQTRVAVVNAQIAINAFMLSPQKGMSSFMSSLGDAWFTSFWLLRLIAIDRYVFPALDIFFQPEI